MKYISEITITGIVKEYVEDFGRRTERENKNLLHSILYKVENICFARIKELEKELEEEKCSTANELIKAAGDISQRNLRIEELTAKVEKMKCCGNCKHQRYDYESRYCEFDATREKECVNLSEWELTK